jgi:hypothetical protein
MISSVNIEFIELKKYWGESVSGSYFHNPSTVIGSNPARGSFLVGSEAQRSLS